MTEEEKLLQASAKKAPVSKVSPVSPKSWQEAQAIDTAKTKPSVKPVAKAEDTKPFERPPVGLFDPNPVYSANQGYNARKAAADKDALDNSLKKQASERAMQGGVKPVQLDTGNKDYTPVERKFSPTVRLGDAKAKPDVITEKPVVNPQVEIYGSEQVYSKPNPIEQVKAVAKAKGVPWYVVLADILEGAGKGYLGDKSQTMKQAREEKAYQQELRDAEIAEASRIRAEETALQNARIAQQLESEEKERALKQAQFEQELDARRAEQLRDITSREKIAGMGQGGVSKPLNAVGAATGMYNLN